MRSPGIFVAALLISGGLVMFAACPFDSAPQLTIVSRAVEVKDAPSGGFNLAGSFYVGPAIELVPEPDGSPFAPEALGKTIASYGSGGACVIADLNFIGIPNVDMRGLDGRDTAPCSDEFCTEGLAAEHKSQGFASYCIEGSCWTRPGRQPEYCRIAPTHNHGEPWPAGVHKFTVPGGVRDKYRPSGQLIGTIADLYRDLGIEGKVRWRVHSCLNGAIEWGVDNKACSDGPGEKLTHDGPIVSLP